MKVTTYLMARWYEVRSNRAYKKYIKFKKKAEVFFSRLGGSS